ncbi:MAG: ABC transporter substrate-binding protein, partial [Rhizobiales bacterium]|nr:ABC transporter substrate-binding protein [Hyphomicrobiales bacterium]
MINRRNVVKAIGATTLGAVATPSLLSAQELRKIRMGFGIKSINPIVINILIAEGLGYTKQEGLAFTPVALGTNSNVQIALDKGDIEFGVGTPSFQFPLFAKGQLPPIVNYYEYTYPYKWDVAVKPESVIQKYQDLKGKKIGVSDLGTTDYPVTRAVLQNLGIDPDKDVTWTAVGAGVSAGVALQRGVIDALAYFDTGFGQIDAAGIAMRMLPRPEKVPLIGGLYISARADYLKNNRKTAVGFARAVNKASEFLLTNPEAGAQVFVKMYPETAPRGASQADAVKSIL